MSNVQPGWVRYVLAYDMKDGQTLTDDISFSLDSYTVEQADVSAKALAEWISSCLEEGKEDAGTLNKPIPIKGMSGFRIYRETSEGIVPF